MIKNTLLFYPTIFSEEDEGINVRIPDLGITTSGINYQDAVRMAQNSVGMKLEEQTEYPEPRNIFDTNLEKWESKKNTKVIIVAYDMEEYRKGRSKTVRRNISIPEYLNNIAKKKNINVSKVTTEALEELIFNE